jgi:hypothetical protein
LESREIKGIKTTKEKKERKGIKEIPELPDQKGAQVVRAHKEFLVLENAGIPTLIADETSPTAIPVKHLIRTRLCKACTWKKHVARTWQAGPPMGTQENTLCSPWAKHLGQ